MGKDPQVFGVALSGLPSEILSLCGDGCRSFHHQESASQENQEVGF